MLNFIWSRQKWLQNVKFSMREHWNEPVSFLQFRLSNRSLRVVEEAAIVRAPIQSRDVTEEQPPNVRSLAATCVH